jgi:S-formylglutathione hydrolase
VSERPGETPAKLTVRSEHRCFDGFQGFYEHPSVACAGPMRFGVYLPPRAIAGASVPVLYFLAGLSCTEETFIAKAGAQRIAAELGLALVTCDTSPRAARFPGDDEHWDFGQGAGFYVDATQAPWCDAYRMYTYVTEELPTLVEAEFPVRSDARGIFGHSMGGHGALVAALRQPGRYRSVSAFAPIVAPGRVPWGEKAFTRYLGPERSTWAAYDATSLIEQGAQYDGILLIDQGTSDKFLPRELRPDLFEAACNKAGQPLEIRRFTGYDHSYFFISTFVEDHLRHHADILHH